MPSMALLSTVPRMLQYGSARQDMPTGAEMESYGLTASFCLNLRLSLQDRFMSGTINLAKSL